MLENYLDILKISLQEKSLLLDKIEKCNMQQEEVLNNEELELSQFDDMIQEKDDLIQGILKLDDGFEKIYAKISEGLSENKEQYATEINLIQELVTIVIDKSMKVQAQEARNKVLVEKYFKNARSEIKMGRKSSKIASDYYKNMSKTAIITPQFMDKKK